MNYLKYFENFNSSEVKDYLLKGTKDGSKSSDYCKLLLNLDDMDLLINQFGGTTTTCIKQLQHNRKELEGITDELRELFLNVQYDFVSPLKIKYGFRTPQQNKAAGGAGNSAHLTGLAIDTYFDQPNKEDIVNLVKISSKHGALGIGVYKDARHFHMDIDASKGRRSWSSGYTSGTIPDWAKDSIKNHLQKKYLIPKTPNYWNLSSQQTTKETDLINWNPKSGVFFLPTQGKGTPTEGSKSSFFGKENYPWIGLPNGVERQPNKPIQYVSIIPGDFEKVLDSIKDGNLDSFRPNTIIIVLWDKSVSQETINSDLKEVMEYLNINSISKVSDNDLKRINTLL